MRRFAALVPLVLVLVLVACGGGGGESGGSDNPLVDAANATAEAGSESTSMTGIVAYDQTRLELEGEGGYNHTTEEGFQQLVVTVPTGEKPTLDEIFVRNVLWMKSDLFTAVLPEGKEWVKVDVAKAGTNLGFNFKALMGTTPADVLRQLQRTSPPIEELGEEEIDGVETTHYRASIDTAKIPRGDNLQRLADARYRPIDVWVDGDDLVRQVRLDYTAKVDPAMATRATVRLTMKLFDFGTTVDVEPPPANLVVDSTESVR
jgi:hypothetical protein